MADVVERVRRERLPVEEVPDRLHAGEAGAAATWCASCRRRAGRSPPRAGPARPPACGRRASGGTGAAAWRAPGASFARRRSSLSSSVVLRTARRPTTDISPSALKAGGPSAANGRSRVRKVSSSSGGGLEVAQHRRLRLRQVAEPPHVGLELRRGTRAGGGRSPQLVPARRRDLRPSGRPRARSRSRPSCGPRAPPMTVCGVADELLDRVRSGGRGSRASRSSRGAPGGRAGARPRGPPAGPARPAPSSPTISRRRSR